MINTLRIARIVAASVAAAFIVLLAVFALRGDGEMEEFLARAGAVEKFRSLAKKTTVTVEKVSPLITQARAFALKLNPPPVPKTVKKPPARKETKTTAKQSDIPIPKGKISTKFKLIGTCKYEQDPERSLALLDSAAKGQKWYRQGQEVDHLTIHQIDNDSITLYKGGVFDSEVSIQRTKQTSKPLLKSDAELLGFHTESIIRNFPAFEAAVLDTTPAAKAPPKKMSSRELLRQRSKDAATARARIVAPSETKTASQAAIAATRRARRQPPRKTPAQRKKDAEDSIAEIKSIMNRAQPGGHDDGAQKDWEKLIKSLEESRDSVDKELESKPKKATGRVETKSSKKPE